MYDFECRRQHRQNLDKPAHAHDHSLNQNRSLKAGVAGCRSLAHQGSALAFAATSGRLVLEVGVHGDKVPKVD